VRRAAASFQRQEAFFEGMSQAFSFWEGIPHSITFDNLKGVFWGAAGGGQAERAFGQPVAEAAAMGYVVDAGEQPRPVAELEAAVQKALFGQFHGAADGAAGGNGVQAELIAEGVGTNDGLQVADAALGTEGPDGLVLGSGGVARPALDQADTLDRAAVTACAAGGQRPGQGLPGNGRGGGKLRFLKVAGGEHAHLVDQVDQDGGAELL